MTIPSDTTAPPTAPKVGEPVTVKAPEVIAVPPAASQVTVTSKTSPVQQIAGALIVMVAILLPFVSGEDRAIGWLVTVPWWAAGLIGLVGVALLLGADKVPFLGAVLTLVFTRGAKLPLGSDKPPRGPLDNQGFIGAELLLILGGLALLLGLWGCPSAHIQQRETIQFRESFVELVEIGPPCRRVIMLDGVVVLSFEVPNACPPRCETSPVMLPPETLGPRHDRELDGYVP